MSVYGGIGIDLGTSNTVCSYMQNGVVVEINWNGTNPYLPSVVSYKTAGKPVVGNPNNSFLFSNTKRLIGKKEFKFYGDGDALLFGGETCYMDDGFLGVMISANNRIVTMRPREIARDILIHCRRKLEEGGVPVNKMGAVTIGVPANFGHYERTETLLAAKEAGFEKCYLLNEPTAAALEYCCRKNLPCGYYIVYDFGGGTFDVSLIEYKIDSNGKKTFRICCSKGDDHLGGADIDVILGQRIRKYMKAQINENPEGLFKNPPKIDLFSNSFIKKSIIKAKELKEFLSTEFSKVNRTEGNLEMDITDLYKSVPNLRFNDDDDDDPCISYSMSSDEFKQMIHSKIKETTELIKSLLDEYHLPNGESITIQDVNRIILVGGSSCLWCIQECLAEELNIKKDIIMRDINPGLSVSHGCCYYSANMSNIVDKGTATNGVDILERSSFSYGIAVADGRTFPLIKKGDPIPSSVTSMFTTTKDNQEVINTAAYLGDSEYTKDNEMIQNVQFTLSSRLPKGVPQIEITYKIQQSNLLVISCCEILESGRKIELGKRELILSTSASHVC